MTPAFFSIVNCLSTVFRPPVILTVIIACTGFTNTSFAQITSTFDADADGWTFPGAIVHHPEGYISSTFSALAHADQHWKAPSKFLGNHVVKSAGMNLKFDLQQSTAGTANLNKGDVVITSPAITITYSFPAKPAVAPDWTTYTIRLDETTAWQVTNTSGTLATRAEVLRALTNITALEIRASYMTQNPYTAAIDNVVMEERTLLTPPSIASFSPESGEAGSTVTITGTNFSAVPSENIVFFGSTRASVFTASASQLVATVPAGATVAPITVINKNTGLSYQSQFQFTPKFKDGGRLIRASFNPKVDMTLTNSAGNGVTGLSLQDMDGDGWIDIVVSEETNTVSIYRNLGTGGDLTAASFALPVVLTGAGSSEGLHIHDLDGDGKPDIAGESQNASVTYFATFRNTSIPGNITFEPVKTWHGLVYSGKLSQVVDVDGDGRPDLIGQHGNGSTAPDFWIAQNVSTPENIAFGGSVSYFGGSTLDAGNSVAAGDLDNDGKPEMIVVHGFGNQFQIIKNNSSPGTIAFGTPFPIAGSTTESVQVFDFNGDGNLDLAFKLGGYTDDIVVLLNTNSDAVLDASDFATRVVFNSEMGNGSSVTFSDLNGDGRADMLATDASNLAVFENVFNGGSFTSSAFVEAYLHRGTNASYPSHLSAADLNGDEKPDIVTGTANTNPPVLSIYQNKNFHAPVISMQTVSPLKGGPGTTVTITGDYFSTVPSENLVRFGSIRASVQSATKTQLVVTVPDGATTGYISVTRNGLSSSYHLPFVVAFSAGVDFDATHFAAPASFTLTGADYDVEVGDLNNDGKADIVAEGTGTNGYAFLNVHTSGAISTASLIADDTISSVTNPTVADLDGDGYSDIVGATGRYRNMSASTELAFEPVVSSSGFLAFNGFADFNRDGKTDIAGVNGSNVFVTENRTTPGSFTTATPTQSFQPFQYPATGNNTGAVTGDFDNDGLTDFAATNAANDNLTVWRNNGSYRITTTQFTSLPNIALGDNPGRLYAADLDVDGRMDLVLYYQATTTSQFITVLHNQSTVGNIAFNRVDFTLDAAGTTATVNDLDGDGRPEVIVVSGAANRFSIFKNNTSPGVITPSSFAAPFHTTVTAPRGITTGDLNGDGKPEIVLTRSAGFLLVYENLIPKAVLSIAVQPVDASACIGSNAIFSVSAAGTTNIIYQWQKLDASTSTYINLVNGGDYAGVNTATLTALNVSSSDAGEYRVLIGGDYVTDQISDAVTMTTNSAPSKPVITVTGTLEFCEGSSVTLSAPAGFSYQWSDGTTSQDVVATQSGSYSVRTSANNCTSESSDIVDVTVNSAPSKPVITVAGSLEFCEGSSVTLSAPTGFSYQWSDGTTSQDVVATQSGSYSVKTSANNCTSESSDIVDVTVNSIPAKPIITVAGALEFCEGSSVTLSAPAGFSYQWSGGEQTQEISASTSGDYSVTITDDNHCSSAASDAVTVITNPNPPIPLITSSNGSALCNEALTLSAPVGYNYEWSTMATSQQITVNVAGNYSVEITDGNGCSSASAIFTVEVGTCNQPPLIESAQAETVIGGTATIDLLALLSDPNNDIDMRSLTIVEMPLSGAQASIDGNQRLHVSYSGVAFSGADQLVIRVCDTQGQCVQQTIFINVIGEIVIYTGLSPNGDGKNDFWLIDNIDLMDGTRNNDVKIFNRWGDLVWEGKNYDNHNVVFTGKNKNGNELPSGNYFYQLNFSDRKSENGYISLRQ